MRRIHRLLRSLAAGTLLASATLLIIGPATAATAAEPSTSSPGLTVSLTTPSPTWKPVEPGMRIEYIIEVVNTGDTALTPVTVTDDLSDVLDEADYMAQYPPRVERDGTAVPSAGLQLGPTTLTWSGDMAAGETVRITYSVQVHHGPPAKVFDNRVSATGFPAGLPEVVAPTASLQHVRTTSQLTMQIDSDPQPGSSICEQGDFTTTLTLTNTGDTDLGYVEVSGKRPKNTPIYPADLRNGVALVDGEPSGTIDQWRLQANGVLSWNGALKQGQQLIITYEGTVIEPPDSMPGPDLDMETVFSARGQTPERTFFRVPEIRVGYHIIDCSTAEPTEPETGEEPGSGTGEEPGSGEEPGASEEPGDADSAGEVEEPGAGTEPGAGQASGTDSAGPKTDSRTPSGTRSEPRRTSNGTTTADQSKPARNLAQTGASGGAAAAGLLAGAILVGTGALTFALRRRANSYGNRALDDTAPPTD